MNRHLISKLAPFIFATALAITGGLACDSEDGGGGGGSSAQGGSAQGGSAQGGSAQGGSAQGGSAQGGGGQGGTGSGGHAPATLGSLNPVELDAALANKDFLLINVHIPDEGQIPGTDIHVPFNDVPALASTIGTDLDSAVVVYCKTDFMATTAGDDLVALGYRSIRYLEGGMMAWEAAGFSLE